MFHDAANDESINQSLKTEKSHRIISLWPHENISTSFLLNPLLLLSLLTSNNIHVLNFDGVFALITCSARLQLPLPCSARPKANLGAQEKRRAIELASGRARLHSNLICGCVGAWPVAGFHRTPGKGSAYASRPASGFETST